MALTQVSTKGLKDGTILNADINASAAIAGTKISSDFGSQNITTTGRLLLGTTTEGHTDADDLTIATSSGYAGITLRSPSDQGGAIYFSDATSGAGEYDGQILYSQSSRTMQLITANNPRLTLDSSGNLLSGTTSSSLLSNFNTNAGGLVLDDIGSGATAFLATHGDKQIFLGNDTSANYLWGYSNHNLLFGTNNQTRLTITSTGTVGIGTSSPSNLLHCSRTSTTAYSSSSTTNDSTVLLQNLGAAGHSTLEFQCKSSGTTQTGKATISATPEAASSRATSLTFGTRNASSAMEERMRINSSGAVGIGTTTPYYPLEVKAATNAYITTERATKAGGQVGIQIRGASGGKDWYLYQHTNSNTLQLYNNTDGNLIAFNENGMSFGYSGDGIDFSNASPSGSGTVASSLLDDYEEGTFSPILKASTSTTGQVTGNGRYTKVGNIVHCNIDFEGVNASGIPDASTTEITGIPFTILNASDNATATTLMSYNVYNANRTNPSFYASGNTTSLFSIYSVSGSAWQHWPTNDINQSTIYLNFSISFFTAT